jgi:hypothetical protein
MWATYFADMNDAQEIHTLRVPLVDELTKRLNPVVKQVRLQNPPQDSVVWRRDAPQHLARVLGNALYRVVFADDDSERTAYCCTACFSSHAGDKPYEREHGLLSQWRGYGKDGGFCLVFDTATLWRLATTLFGMPICRSSASNEKGMFNKLIVRARSAVADAPQHSGIPRCVRGDSRYCVTALVV